MMLMCKEATQLLSESLEHRLPWRDRLRLRLHVLICAGCRRTGEQFSFLHSISRRWRDGALTLTTEDPPEKNQV